MSILEVLLQAFLSDKTKIEDNTFPKCLNCGDIFPLQDFIHLMEKYPAVTLKFLPKLQLLDNYDLIVKWECEKAVIEEGEKMILGSSARSPLNFWKEHFYSNDEQSTGVPVISKLVPFRSIASSTALLSAVVVVAEITKIFNLFESAILVSLIDFK